MNLSVTDKKFLDPFFLIPKLLAKMDSLQFDSEISDVQEDLVRLNLRTRSLIDSFQKVESHDEMERLNGDIRIQLDLMRNGLSNLRELAKKQRNLESSSMLIADANNHEDQLSACQLAFKKANLACISRLNARGREALFRSSTNNSLNTNSEDKEILVKESGKATEKLRTISRHLAATVERSSKTMDDLVESSGTMKEASEEFKSQGSVISQSKKLITKYARRMDTDRVLILFAAAFFFAVVFYILRKRVLGPFDPFALIWSSITTFISTIINLLISEPKNSDQQYTQHQANPGDNARAEL